MIRVKWLALVNGGRLDFRDRDGIKQYIRTFQDMSEVYVTITKKVRDRSTNQNAYYWGVVLKLIAKETGHTEEELHEIFKRKFLPPKIVKWRDTMIKMPSSTADTTTLEFTDYIERIRAEAGTMGITIPNPDQIHF